MSEETYQPPSGFLTMTQAQERLGVSKATFQKIVKRRRGKVWGGGRATPLEAYWGSFCCLKSIRSFILALCSCDFEVPTEQPRSREISSCSCPSTSWRTKTER